MPPTHDLSIRHLPSTSMSLSDVSDTSFSFQIPTATGEEENLLSSQAGFEFFKGMAEQDVTLADLPQHSAAAAADHETVEKQEHDFGEMGVGPTPRRNPRRRARDTLTTNPTKKPELLAPASISATPTRIPTGQGLPPTPTTTQRSSVKPPSKIARRISTSKPPSASHTTQTATVTNQFLPTSRSYIRQPSAQPPSTSTAFTSSQPHIPPPADADGDTASDRRASGADDRILNAWQRTTTISSLIPAIVVPDTRPGLDPPLCPATDQHTTSTTTTATPNIAMDVSSDPDPNSPLPLPLISVGSSTSNSTSAAAHGAASESTIAMDPRFDFSLNDGVPSPTLVSTPVVQANGDRDGQDDSTLPRDALIPCPDGSTLDPVASSSSRSPLTLPRTFHSREDQGTEGQDLISVAGLKMGMESAVTVKPGRTRVHRAKRKTVQSGGGSSDTATPIAEMTLAGSATGQVKDASRKDENASILRVELTSHLEGRPLLEGDSHVSSSTAHSSSTLNGLPPVSSRSRSRSGGAQAPVHGRVAKARISDRKKSQVQQRPVHDAGRKGVIGPRNVEASYPATSVEAGGEAVVVVDKAILALESYRAASSSSPSLSLLRRVSSESRQESNGFPMPNLPSDFEAKVIPSKELNVLDSSATEVLEKDASVTDPGRAAGKMDLCVGPVVDGGSGLCSDRTTRRQSQRLRRGGQKPTQEAGPARKRERLTPPPSVYPAETEVGPKRTGDALEEQRAAKRQRTESKKVAIPNFAAMHAAQEARVAAVRGKARLTRPVGPVLTTDRRARERERFDTQVRERERELDAVREQRRLEEEAAEAEAIAELRRRAVPRANSVPEWYCSRPKRERKGLDASIKAKDEDSESSVTQQTCSLHPQSPSPHTPQPPPPPPQLVSTTALPNVAIVASAAATPPTAPSDESRFLALHRRIVSCIAFKSEH